MHTQPRQIARISGCSYAALLQCGVALLLGSLTIVIAIAPIPASAQESVGFYQRPAFNPLAASVDAGPANSPGWTNDFTRRGMSWGGVSTDVSSSTRLNMGLTANAFLGNFVRLAVGYAAADPYGAIDDGLEAAVGVGYSFSKTDIVAQASYVYNFASCDGYGSVPKGLGLGGTLAQRAGDFTFELGGGVHIFTAQYMCAYEGGGWGFIRVHPRVGWQLSKDLGFGFQLQMLAGKSPPIFQPKVEAVYTLMLGSGAVDLSAALELSAGQATRGAQIAFGAAVRFE